MARQRDRQGRELLRIGELASAVGKSSRALHFYEELGLLKPVSRSSGGFRLFSPDAIGQIGWINKLQAIGFSLTEIRGFVDEFEKARDGRTATGEVRRVFEAKLRETLETIAQLKIIQHDLEDAIAYLESCHSCEVTTTPNSCGACDQQGHEPGEAPALFAGLSRVACEPQAGSSPDGSADPEPSRNIAPDVTIKSLKAATHRAAGRRKT